MIGKRLPNGKIRWMSSAADALSGLLSPKRKRPRCRLCQRLIKPGMINSCVENHCPRARSEA